MAEIQRSDTKLSHRLVPRAFSQSRREPSDAPGESTDLRKQPPATPKGRQRKGSADTGQPTTRKHNVRVIASFGCPNEMAQTR